jgi:hydroxymethylpyrimidine pyrophosphatase-like HAD family hydrolase
MNCFIFDIDGVIVNLETTAVDFQIIKAISQIFSKNMPVAFVSGRSSFWITKNIIAPVKKNIDSEKLLDNILILGEFGSSLTYYENSRIISTFDNKHILPIELIKKLSEITNEYSSVLKIDETKQTQFSSEMKDGLDIEKDFNPIKKELVERYKNLVSEFKMENELEVTEDRKAVNVKYKSSNKGASIKVLMSWVNNKGLNINTYFAFGDTESDLEMAEELRKQKKDFEFVYVGEKEEIEDQDLTGIKFTKEKFEKGTLEFLLNINY